MLQDQRRSPQGERGLKLDHAQNLLIGVGSLPARGAWIEISVVYTPIREPSSLPARGAWIEIVMRRGSVT